jgi:hypothetical protein
MAGRAGNKIRKYPWVRCLGHWSKDQSVLAQAQVNLTRYQTLEREKSIAAQQAQDQHLSEIGSAVRLEHSRGT